MHVPSSGFVTTSGCRQSGAIVRPGSGRAFGSFMVLDETEGVRPPAGVALWLQPRPERWTRRLRALGSLLIVRRGPAERVVADFAAEMDCQAVYLEPASMTMARANVTRLSRLSSPAACRRDLKANLAVRRLGK